MREQFRKESPMISLVSLGGGGTGLALGGASGGYPADTFWISVASRGNWDNEYTEKLDWDNEGNIYVNSIRYNAGGVGYKGGSFFKHLVDGSVDWQKVQYKSATPYGMESRVVTAELDGDHIYTAGQSDSGCYVCKINKSDGTVDWRRTIGSNTNPNNNPMAAAMGSDGNPIFIIRWNEGADQQLYLSLNASDGSSNWSTFITRNAGSSETNTLDTCHPKIDSSGNIHSVVYGRPAHPNYYSAVVKHNSSGVLQSITDYQTSSTSEDKFTDVAIDSSGNKYIAARYYTGSGNINSSVIKVNSSDVIQWQTTIVASGNACYPEQIEMTLDESGVIIKLDDRRASPGNVHSFVRLNTSDGSQVWRRYFYGASPANSISGSRGRMRLNRNGNIIFNTYYSDGQTYTITAQLPSDGSLTGSYTPSGYPALSWAENTALTVTDSVSLWTKQSSSIFSSGSVTPTNAAYSNVTLANNVQVFTKVDVS